MSPMHSLSKRHGLAGMFVEMMSDDTAGEMDCRAFLDDTQPVEDIL